MGCRRDEDLARGGHAQGDAALAQPADDRAGFGTVLEDFSRGVQFEAAFAQVTQKGWILVHHPDDSKVLAWLAACEWNALGLGERAVGAWNGVAVGVDRGIPEVGVDSVDQPFGGGVLHVLGFFVNLVPGHGEGLGKEPLEQAMAANDFHGKPLTGLGQTCAFVWGVSGEAGFGERFEHPGDGAGRDVQSLCELAGRDGATGGVAGCDERDGLDIVFDGQAGHGVVRAPGADRLAVLPVYILRYPLMPEEGAKLKRRTTRECFRGDRARRQDQFRDAGGSRTHLNRVATGRLAVWLQRQESHVPARN